jgi:hypothetical protein
MALKRQEKMIVVNMYFLQKIAALWLYFSHLYQQITPSKYANNYPKICALVSRVSEQNLRASLGLV